VSASTSEINKLAGLTSNTAELNILDGVIATTAEINKLAGLLPTQTELNYVDGVTSAIQTQIDTKAPLASPTLTGVPQAPTAAVTTNTTQIATTAFVNAEIAGDVGVANSALVKTALNASGSAPIYGVRARGLYDGVADTLTAGSNIASVVRSVTGVFVVTFTTAMPDANYTVVVSAGNESGSVTTSGAVCWAYGRSTSGFTIGVGDNNTETSLNRSLIDFIVVG